MRNVIFFIAIIAFAGCNKSNETPYTILKGEIENPQEKILTVKGSDFEVEIPVNDDGTFEDTLDVKEGYYNIGHNREYTTAYLKPGFDLKLTLNTIEFDESVAYSGVGAKENNFIARKFLLIERELPSTPELYALNSKDFLDKISKIKSTLEKSISGLEIDGKFMLNELKSIDFDYISSIQKYPSYHAHYAKDDTMAIDSSMLNYVQTVNFDNSEDFDMFQNYRDIVVREFMEGLSDEPNAAEIVGRFNKYESENIKNGIAKKLIYYLSPTEPDMEELYQGLLAVSTDEEFTTKLTEKYNKLKDLVAGKPSPKFAFADTNGETVALSDLKGKLVYVDVWATWCGPCKREIPHLKALESEYRGKAIEFVSISVDKAKDHQTWLDMVADKELKGIQLFADKDWKSDFVKGYAIDGIPRFILIDKNGNIISADAPRPSSDEEIKSLIDENLKS